MPRRTSDFSYSQFNVNADAGSGNAQLIARANPKRIELWLYNNSPVAIALGKRSVTFGVGTADPGFIMAPSGEKYLDHYTGELYATANGAVADLRVAEFVDLGGRP